MSLTIDEAIARFEANTEQNERWASGGLNPEANVEYAAEHRQLAAWLRILKKAKFEYDEAWKILTHPTPDVRYPDINRAKMILDVFGNSLGRMEC
jgi:hypothetical protein